MGLNQGRKRRRAAGLGPPAHWLLPTLILLVGGLFAALGDSGQAWLRYEREAIAAGQIWRLLSGHLVHLGWGHYLLNAAGVALVWLLVGRAFTPVQWSAVFLGTVMGIDLGFWVLNPGLTWYVGASGVLHGLLVAGLIAGFRASRLESGLLLVAIGAKLGYEQLAGPLPGSESAAGGPVVVDAHFYGAVAGAVVACALLIRVRRSRAI